MKGALVHVSSISTSISPIRVFGLVLAVVFAVELGIMLVVAGIPWQYRNDFWLSIADSATLVAVLCPALWVLIVRPLRALVTERGKLLSRSLEIQEAERARLSRDLHDELGQTQTAVLLGLRAVLNAPDLEQVRERANAVHQMASAAIESTRRISRGLSPTVLRDFGIGPAVERVCEDFAAAGTVEIARELRIGSLRLEPEIEIAAYRFVQEAITNAAKHAHARRIQVVIEHVRGELSIRVTDDGRGIDPASMGRSESGLGLIGMRERIVLHGGGFFIDSGPSAGTTIRATIPAKVVTS